MPNRSPIRNQIKRNLQSANVIYINDINIYLYILSLRHPYLAYIALYTICTVTVTGLAKATCTVFFSRNFPPCVYKNIELENSISLEIGSGVDVVRFTQETSRSKCLRRGVTICDRLLRLISCSPTQSIIKPPPTRRGHQSIN